MAAESKRPWPKSYPEWTSPADSECSHRPTPSGMSARFQIWTKWLVDWNISITTSTWCFDFTQILSSVLHDELYLYVLVECPRTLQHQVGKQLQGTIHLRSAIFCSKVVLDSLFWCSAEPSINSWTYRAHRCWELMSWFGRRFFSREAIATYADPGSGSVLRILGDFRVVARWWYIILSTVLRPNLWAMKRFSRHISACQPWFQTSLTLKKVGIPTAGTPEVISTARRIAFFRRAGHNSRLPFPR